MSASTAPQWRTSRCSIQGFRDSPHKGNPDGFPFDIQELTKQIEKEANAKETQERQIGRPRRGLEHIVQPGGARAFFQSDMQNCRADHEQTGEGRLSFGRVLESHALSPKACRFIWPYRDNGHCWRRTAQADRPPAFTEGPSFIASLVRDVYLSFRSSLHALRPWVAA